MRSNRNITLKKRQSARDIFYKRMNNMKLGTHNSMTYLKPKHWWMYPFRFMARCQNLTIEQQYEYGVRYFDLRVKYNKNNGLEFKHGLMTYKGRVYDILNYLDSRKEPVYCKFCLEISKEDKEQEDLFKYYCEIFEKHYKNIKFYGGHSKAKRDIYLFKVKEPDLDYCFASGHKPLIDDLWPWLYAKLHNRKAKARCKKKILILDFVEI